MPQFLPAMRQLVADLNEADPTLRAAIDMDRVNPPATWITLVRLEDFTLDDGCEAVLALYVVVPDQSDEAALAQLAPLLSALLDTLGSLGLPTALEPIEAQRVVTPYSGGTELPAFRILTSITV